MTHKPIHKRYQEVLAQKEHNIEFMRHMVMVKKINDNPQDYYPSLKPVIVRHPS